MIGACACPGRGGRSRRPFLRAGPDEVSEPVTGAEVVRQVVTDPRPTVTDAGADAAEALTHLPGVATARGVAVIDDDYARPMQILGITIAPVTGAARVSGRDSSQLACGVYVFLAL